MFPVLGSFQGHLSPRAGPCCVGNLVHLCASVLVSLCSCPRGCARGTRSPSCDAPLLLRGCGPGAALRAVAQQWLFLRPLCFVRARRVVASLDLQGSSLLACSPGWRVPGSLGLMCVPCLHELLVPCRVPSATIVL